MCTVVILRRPDHPWPVLIAANRDEMAGRPSAAPARHWPDRPEVTAGLDRLAGGTWMGLNDHGLMAAVLNRHNTLGPLAGYRSRGELPLDALDHADAAEAAEALGHLEPTSFRSFNMVLADNRDAFWLRSDGAAISVHALPTGLGMVTAHDLDDPASARIRRYRGRFEAAPIPDPQTGDWAAWRALLADTGHDAEAGPNGAMNVHMAGGFGTVSSSLLALPAMGRIGVRPVWLYAPGRPDRTDFQPVSLG